MLEVVRRVSASFRFFTGVLQCFRRLVGALSHVGERTISCLRSETVSRGFHTLFIWWLTLRQLSTGVY